MDEPVSVPWWQRETTVEVAIAASVGVLTFAGVAGELAGVSWSTPPAAGAYALAAVTVATLVWRRRRPAVVATAVCALVAVYHLVGYPGLAPLAVLYVAVYSLAAYGATARSLAGAVALSGVAYVIPQVPPHRWPWSSAAVYAPVIGLLWVALLGAAVRRRRLDTEDRVRRAAAVAEAEVRQRLAEERLRIARDLHDVLAHTISVISVQGGNALDALDTDPHATREALGAIRTASRQALAELRAALGLLRADGPLLHPQPDLGQVAELVAQAEATGLRVDLRMPDLDGLSPVVGLTAYRVVQEALTNVVRHADAGSVVVSIRPDGEVLLVEVTDDGHGPAPGTGGAGLGLVGMRERAEALGGTVAAGPRPDGGYRVLATLPL
jgi:signal transduction histidine kinase